MKTFTAFMLGVGLTVLFNTIVLLAPEKQCPNCNIDNPRQANYCYNCGEMFNNK